MMNGRMILMENNGGKILLIKYRAGDLPIVFPDNKLLDPEEKEGNRNAIKTGGIIRDDGKAFINKNKIKKLLNTDTTGAKKVYNDLDEDEKFVNGNSKFADACALMKELTKRIQEPRIQLDREKLKDSRDCINALIDSPTLEKERTLESDRIQKKLPKLTQKKIKAENIVCDQLTGEEFDNDAEGHHKERKSDNPRAALDPQNIIVTKKKNHKEIHKNGAEDKESLKNFALKKNWNTANI